MSVSRNNINFPLAGFPFQNPQEQDVKSIIQVSAGVFEATNYNASHSHQRATSRGWLAHRC